MRTEDPIVYNHLLFNSLTPEEIGFLRLIGDKGGQYDINRLAHTHTYTVDEVAETVSALEEKGLCDLFVTSRKANQMKTIITNVALTQRGISFYNIDLGILPSRKKRRLGTNRLQN